MSTADKIGKNGDEFELDGNQSGSHELVLYRSERDNQDQILVEPKLPKATPAVRKRAKDFTTENKLSASGSYDQKLEDLADSDPEVYRYLTEMKQYVSDLDEYEKLKRRMRKNTGEAIDAVFGSVRQAVDNNMKSSIANIADITGETIVEEHKKASGE